MVCCMYLRFVTDYYRSHSFAFFISIINPKLCYVNKHLHFYVILRFLGGLYKICTDYTACVVGFLWRIQKSYFPHSLPSIRTVVRKNGFWKPSSWAKWYCQYPFMYSPDRFIICFIFLSCFAHKIMRLFFIWFKYGILLRKWNLVSAIVEWCTRVHIKSF